ncbi:hypothetical protein BSL78_05180 [Apostichopus japonicus]|uniref:Uncharacterized protein n=1 Tax=Stichopus japonicus TaxID=307972 RepID=A0A2G8LCC0_STIJA|nr:hypothetical protein BSL78_05180 [Apostichopus japonicus]
MKAQHSCFSKLVRERERKVYKEAPLIDWEDIFTSRQSFCELDSPVRKTKLPFFPDSTADINANFSTTSEVTAWLSRSRHLEDKGIMTSPYQFPNCSCSRSTFQNPANKLPLYTATEGALPNRSVYALPLQSVDDFSDRDSLSSLESLESLEMDDSVFRESLYSLSSEQLYQSQTFTQVTDEIYEDSLCEDVPSGRQPLFDPEPIEDTINQLDFTGSMLSSCFSKACNARRETSQIIHLKFFASNVKIVLSVQAMKLDLDLSTSPTRSVADGFRKQPDNLYRLNFVSKETPVRYIKNKPLKPIHQVDAEYRCRKGIA